MAEPIISDVERHSAVWIKIKAHCESEITRLRALNDKTMDALHTEKLRGRIKELRNLAALDIPAPPAGADDE